MILLSLVTELWMLYVVTFAMGLLGSTCLTLCGNVIVQQNYSVAQASGILGAEDFLQGMASVCCVLFLAVAVLLVVLIHDENNIKRISEQKEQSERALM